MFSGWLTPSGKAPFQHHSLWGKSAPMQDKTVWLPRFEKWGVSRKRSSSWITFQARHCGEKFIGGWTKGKPWTHWPERSFAESMENCENVPTRPAPTCKCVEHYHQCNQRLEYCLSPASNRTPQKTRKASGRITKPHFSSLMGTYQFLRRI